MAATQVRGRPVDRSLISHFLAFKANQIVCSWLVGSTDSTSRFLYKNKKVNQKITLAENSQKLDFSAHLKWSARDGWMQAARQRATRNEPIWA